MTRSTRLRSGSGVEAAEGPARHRPFPRLRALPAPGGADTPTYWLLLIVVVVLNVVGLVMVLSASSVVSLDATGSSWSDFVKQAVWMVLGFGALTVMLYTDLGRWRRHSRLLLFGSVLLLVAVFVPGVGVSANGATRWIGAGPLQVQPSELAKLGMLVFLADLLARRTDRIADVRYSVRPVVAVIGVVGALIMGQPNLGTTIVVATIGFAVLLAAGAPWRSVSRYAIAGVVAAAALSMSSGYRRARVLSFLHPSADPQGNGFQLIQSRIGLASGGLFGLGLGNSRAKWGFLPFAHTDFIFAIIGEELGLVGAVLVVALYVALAVLGMRAAAQAADPFGRLVATGVTTWLVVQAFVNIGVVVGIVPITGVPLPFISFGGSSLLVTLASTGLLLNVARHPAPAEARSAPTVRRGADARRARQAASALAPSRG